MRKITKDIIRAWRNNEERTINNSYTDGTTLFLFGNAIARKTADGGLEITSAGWKTSTTKERLNGIPGVSVYQEKYVWYLNGKEWVASGQWTNVALWDCPRPGGDIDPIPTYSIIRFYQACESSEVIKTGLTLAAAQAHCSDPSTREDGVWFDGYKEENQ